MVTRSSTPCCGVSRARAADCCARLRDEDPRAASVRHSMPLWIVELWWEALGAQSARALLARTNEPAENSLRANTLRTDAASLAASLRADGVAAEAARRSARGGAGQRRLRRPRLGAVAGR